MAKYHYKYRRPQRRRLPFKKILWCLAALMLLAYPFWEATTLTVEEHTLYVNDLPANLKNLKIVFASDIHQCAWFSQSRVNELIGTINGLNADIIILGGDYARRPRCMPGWACSACLETMTAPSPKATLAF